MMNKFLMLTIIAGVVLAGCSPATVASTPVAASPSAEPLVLTVMAHDSFSISEAVVSAFESANQVKVSFLKAGDTGAALNRAILSREAPLADVFYGVDNTFLSRALEADIFEPYQPAGLQALPEEFRMDGTFRATPVDYGDVCINYDKAWFAEHNLEVPASLATLDDEAYRGLLVVENPAVSSPGLAFLLASVSQFGDPGYLAFWEGLRRNGVVVVNDWETAYYTNFSGSSGRGSQPMVVSYNSSPAAEVLFASQPLEDAPTSAITAAGACFRQVEFAGILRGTPQRSLAEKWLDAMLNLPFQEDIPLQMFVYPVNPEAKLPEAFTKYSPVVKDPARLNPQAISVNRDRWITAWEGVMLK